MWCKPWMLMRAPPVWARETMSRRRLRRQNLEKLDAAWLGARLGAAPVSMSERWAVRPAIEVGFGLPARQHDIPSRLRAVLEHFQPFEPRHLIHLTRALRPTLLEARCGLSGDGDMEQRDNHGCPHFSPGMW